MSSRVIKPWKEALYIYSSSYAKTLQAKIDSLRESKGNTCTFEDFKGFDILHPAGHTGVEMLIKEYKFGPQSKLLDIGCGLGGPSRFLNAHTGAHVYGIDILDHFLDLARQMSKLCDKENELTYHYGDLNTYEYPQSYFDAVYSIAVFINYIPGNEGFKRAYSALKPGGFFYIEDYYSLIEPNDMSEEQLDILYTRLSFTACRSKKTIINQLEDAGFTIERFDDFGKVTSEFAWERSQNILSEYKAKGEKGDEVFMQTVDNYGLTIPRVLNHIQQISPEEVQRRFPRTCEYLQDWRDLVYGNRSFVSSARIIARKPVQSSQGLVKWIFNYLDISKPYKTGFRRLQGYQALDIYSIKRTRKDFRLYDTQQGI